MFQSARPAQTGAPLPACVRTLVSLLALLAACTMAFAAYPDLAVPTPNPEPALPGAFDTFAPPVDASTPAANAPEIAECTRTGAPDNTLILAGEQFSSYAGTDQGKDTRFLTYGQTDATGTETSAKMQRLDGRKAVITLDSTLPSWSMYLLWPRNSNGYGYPVAVNKTEAWWLGPKYATRGGTTSVFGRNLSHDNATTNSWVWIKTGPSTMTAATVTAVNPYKVDFTVPGDLANGEYEVWMHNGHGGHYGWSGPLTLTVIDGPNWNGSTFNVQSYGATGDGSTDDTAAITAAYNAAKTYKNANPTLYPTLYFPAGNYIITAQFTPVSNIRWLGAGRTSTYIKAGPGWVRSYCMFFNDQGPSNLEFKDMTLDANGYLDSSLGILFRIRRGSEVRMTDVGLIAPTYNIFDFHDTSRLYLTGLHHIGKNAFFGTGSQVFIDDCDFYGTNDTGTILLMWGRDGVSVTNCTAQDYDNSSATGWCQGRFFTGQAHWDSNRDTYIGGNTTTDMTVRPECAEQNTGEQLMWEGNYTKYRDSPSSATSTTVTFSGLATSYVGQDAIITDGRGMGQHRTISAFDSGTGTITVSEPWRVIPDATSTLIIAAVASRCAIYDNYLDGKDRAVTSVSHIGSAGVQPYGNGHDFVVANNTFNSIRYALSNWALGNSDPTAHQPSTFHLYTDNTIQNCRWGASVFVYYYSDASYDPGMAQFGCIYRSNSFSNLTLNAIQSSDGYTCLGKPLNTTVFEHNTITNTPVGFDFTSGAHLANFTLYKNSANRGTATYAGSMALNYGAASKWTALRENTWSNFETTYAGTTPGAVLEVPARYLTVTARKGKAAGTTTLTLWNSGTASMDWSASDDAAWLTLSSTSGTLSSEGATAALTVTCNQASLTPGTYTGTITVTAGAQTMKATVVFTVDPFLATELSDLKLWVKGDTGVTKDGSNYVTEWADQSGSGNHFSSATNCYPVWVSSAMNSQPVIRFDGVNDYLRRALSSTLTGTFTVYVACQSPDGQVDLIQGGVNNRVFSAPTTTHADWEKGLCLTSGTASAFTQTLKSQVKTVDDGQQVNYLGLGALINSAGNLGNSFHFTGDIAEVLLYNRALTTDEANALVDYLKAKYNIP